MNSVILIGRLTKDPELRYTAGQKQTAVVNFTLAVNRPFSKNNEADFIRIIAFGKTAENCANYLGKGSQAGVQGRLQTGSYDKDGQKHYTTDVVADRIEFLSKSGGGNSAPANAQAQDEEQTPDGFAEYEEDDVPF